MIHSLALLLGYLLIVALALVGLWFVVAGVLYPIIGKGEEWEQGE